MERHSIEKFLETQGYYSLRQGPFNSIIGLCNFIYTVAIVVGIDQVGYSHRYCYKNLGDAMGALDDWEKKNWEGEPEGYIVRKGIGQDKQGNAQ